jgi:hypothetical protein
MEKYLMILIIVSCSSKVPKPKEVPKFKIGDKVCVISCPSFKYSGKDSCDQVVKEITKTGSIWTEPACMGPVGLYGPSDLILKDAQ